MKKAFFLFVKKLLMGAGCFLITFAVAKSAVVEVLAQMVTTISHKQEINENYNKTSTYALRPLNDLKINLPANSGTLKNPVQYLECGNEKYLVYFDRSNNVIYWVDYHTGDAIESKTVRFDVPHEGRLNNFFVLSQDSILVLDYNRTSTLFLLNAQGIVSDKYALGTNKGLLIGPEQQPYLLGNELYLTGNFIDEEETKPGAYFPCYVYNVESQTKEPLYKIDYPKEYFRYHWGGAYMRELSSSVCYAQKSMLYNFPISHNIYVYDLEAQEVREHKGGSSLIEKITPYGTTKKYNSIEQTDYLKYYFEQPSYEKVLHDPYRSLYYRFVGLPSEQFDIKDFNTYKKRIAVIIFDENFQFLGETLLDEQHEPWRAFVNKKGLHIISEYKRGKSFTYSIFEPHKIEPN